MPRNIKKSAKNGKSTGAFTVSDAAVRQIVEDTVANALRTQAREMEAHLENIHNRLVALEGR